MPDPHTLLLVPPPGDTTLLAAELGRGWTSEQLRDEEWITIFHGRAA